MKKQKVIIVSATNFPPQQELEAELAKLDDGWKIVSANTSVTPFGIMGEGLAQQLNVPSSRAAHTYYVTTVVLEKP